MGSVVASVSPTALRNDGVHALFPRSILLKTRQIGKLEEATRSSRASRGILLYVYGRVGELMRAPIKVVALCGRTFFWTHGLLNPNSPEIHSSCVAVLSVVYSGHRAIHRVAFLFSSKVMFLLTISIDPLA